MKVKNITVNCIKFHFVAQNVMQIIKNCTTVYGPNYGNRYCIYKDIKEETEKVNIHFRIQDGRNIHLFDKSEIEVNPALWDIA